MNSKKKMIRASQIMIIFSIIVFCIIYSMQPPKAYASIEKALQSEEGVKPTEILNTLEANDIILILYHKGSTMERDFAYRCHDAYYLDKNYSKTIFSSELKNHFITIKKINKKYVINITNGFYAVGVVQISDSLSSKFEYVETPFYEQTSRNWLLVLDSIPKDYTITIDGEELSISLNK